jgi:hypothetical protein
VRYGATGTGLMALATPGHHIALAESLCFNNLHLRWYVLGVCHHCTEEFGFCTMRFAWVRAELSASQRSALVEFKTFLDTTFQPRRFQAQQCCNTRCAHTAGVSAEGGSQVPMHCLLHCITSHRHHAREILFPGVTCWGRRALQ